MKLAQSAVSKEVVCSHDLSVKSSRDQSFALDFAGLGIGDGDVVDFEGAAEGAFVIGFGFFEVGQRAEFGTLGGY
jgi:hypothetical protein